MCWNHKALDKREKKKRQINILALTAEVIVSGLRVAVVATRCVIVDVLAVMEITACTSEPAGSVWHSHSRVLMPAVTSKMVSVREDRCLFNRLCRDTGVFVYVCLRLLRPLITASGSLTGKCSCNPCP